MVKGKGKEKKECICVAAITKPYVGGIPPLIMGCRHNVVTLSLLLVNSFETVRYTNMRLKTPASVTFILVFGGAYTFRT